MSINFYKQKDLHWVLEIFLQFSLIQRYEETLYTVSDIVILMLFVKDYFFKKKLKKHKKSDKLLDKFKLIGYIVIMDKEKNKEEIREMKTLNGKDSLKLALFELEKVYREFREKKYTDYNLDVAVKYGVRDFYNMYKHLSKKDASMSIMAEVEYYKEIITALP